MSKYFREPVNGFTHMGAAIAAVIGLGLLLYLSRTNLVLMTVLLIYGLSLIMMFTASSIYHLVKGGPTVMQTVAKVRPYRHLPVDRGHLHTDLFLLL